MPASRSRPTRPAAANDLFLEPGLVDIDSPATTSKHKPERRHACLECPKAFTTSGHLARHVKTHTGERAHKCPFPGCNTTCSRQDNLQQHYRVHLSPTSKRASNADNRAAIARARAAPKSRRSHKYSDSQPEDDGPVFVPSAYQAHSVPSPPSSPPPLGDAHPDILTGRRPANPLPSGEQPVPIFVTPTMEQALRLGLPQPTPLAPGAVAPPSAWIRAPNGALVPYDERRPYEALGYTNFLPYALRAPVQATPEELRQAQWTGPIPSTPVAGPSSWSTSSSSPSASTSSSTVSTSRTSPPRAVHNPPTFLPSPPGRSYGRPGFEREVLEKQALAHQPTAPSTSTFAYTPAPAAPIYSPPVPAPMFTAPPPTASYPNRPLGRETTFERFHRMAESIPPPPRSMGGSDPFRSTGFERGPVLPPLRIRECDGDASLRLPPLVNPQWPAVHAR